MSAGLALLVVLAGSATGTATAGAAISDPSGADEPPPILDPSTSDEPPRVGDPIWDLMFARAAVVQLGGGFFSPADALDDRPFFFARVRGAERISNAQHFDALRFSTRVSRKEQRYDLRVVGFEEVVLGTNKDGGPCLPPLFVVWPKGQCNEKSGLFAFSLAAGEFDFDATSTRWNARFGEVKVGVDLPGAAHGATHPLFHVPLWIGFSLDRAGELIPRGVAGFDLVARSWDKSMEANASLRVRPSLAEGWTDVHVELSAQVMMRFRMPINNVARLVGFSFEAGLTHSSLPNTAIGEMYSREEPTSVFVLLGIEGSMTLSVLGR